METLIDPETCSWCVAEVEDSSLREIKGGDGARICKACQNEVISAALTDGLIVVFVK